MAMEIIMEFASHVAPVVRIAPLLPIVSVVAMDMGIIMEYVNDAGIFVILVRALQNVPIAKKDME